jgi:hypothetical protein
MEWQPIETAPKDGKPFLVNNAMELYYDGSMAPSGDYEHPVVVVWEEWPWAPSPDMTGRFKGINASIAFSWDGIDYATHWMPLPAKPDQVP